MKAISIFGGALCIAFALSAAHNLDRIDEAESHAKAQAKKEQLALARFEKAAQAICGQNAGWRVDGISVTCTTKRGFVTQTVKF